MSFKVKIKDRKDPTKKPITTWAFPYEVYVDGKLKRRRKQGFATKKEADAAELAFNEQLKRQGNAIADRKPNDSMLLSYDRLYEHFKETKSAEIEESSWASKDEKITNHIKPYFEKFDMWYISAEDVRQWHKWLDQKKGIKTGEKLTLVFKNDIHSILVQMLNHGISYFNMERNVASVTGGFKAKVKDKIKKEKKFYTIEQFEKYANALKEEEIMWRVYFNLLYFSGMRRSESKGLKWIDIDFENNMLHIRRNVVKNRNKKLTKLHGKPTAMVTSSNFSIINPMAV